MNEEQAVVIIITQRSRGLMVGVVRDAETGELLISATLDYCLEACIARSYNITNAQTVLMLLHKQKRINYEV